MFISKKKLVELIRKDVDEEVVHHERRYHNNIIACSKCKCLISSGDAIKGKSEIRKKYKTVPTRDYLTGCFTGYTQVEDGEYIHNDYYCHRCVPKGKEKK